MKYTRKDIIGQVEEFEGDPIEIMEMIKLIDMDSKGSVLPYIDSGCYGISILEDELIGGFEDEI